MAMQMLAAGGLEVVTDGVRAPGEDNPNGYIEHERVKDLYKDGEDRGWIKESRGKAIKIISFLLRHLPDTNNYKVIFMRRRLPEVLASQSKMLENRGKQDKTPDEQMLKIWEDHLWKVNYFLKHTKHFEVINVAYREAVSDPLQQAMRIQDFLGYPMDVVKMAAGVDENLYHNRG